MTDEQIETQWNAGNDAGEGFALFVADESLSPTETLELAGATEIRTFDAHGIRGYHAIGRVGEHMVAVMDDNGPWAVVVGAA